MATQDIIISLVSVVGVLGVLFFTELQNYRTEAFYSMLHCIRHCLSYSAKTNQLPSLGADSLGPKGNYITVSYF